VASSKGEGKSNLHATII